MFLLAFWDGRAIISIDTNTQGSWECSSGQQETDLSRTSYTWRTISNPATNIHSIKRGYSITRTISCSPHYRSTTTTQSSLYLYASRERKRISWCGSNIGRSRKPSDYASIPNKQDLVNQSRTEWVQLEFPTSERLWKAGARNPPPPQPGIRQGFSVGSPWYWRSICLSTRGIKGQGVRQEILVLAMMTLIPMRLLRVVDAWGIQSGTVCEGGSY